MKAVYAQWGDLPHASFRLLAYMALVSMDADKPPRYWGGREDLAAALGREVPPENDDDPEVCRQRNAAFKVQRDATGILAQRGAIKAIKNARGGQRQEWALNLRRSQVHENRAPEGEEVPTVVHEKRAPQAHEKRADRCTDFVVEAHEKRAPKEDQEPQGDNKRISQSAQELEAAQLLHARYRLTDHESAQVIAEAHRRAATPIRNLVPYLTGEMTTNGSLAAIVEAVQLQRTGEESFPVQPDDEPEYQPLIVEQTPQPLRDLPPADVLDLSGRQAANEPLAHLTREQKQDWLHAQICKTLLCERCAQVAELERATA